MHAAKRGVSVPVMALSSLSCCWLDFKGSRKTAQNLFHPPLMVTWPPFKQPLCGDHILFAKPRSHSQGFAADTCAKAEPGEFADLRQGLPGTQQPPPQEANTSTEFPANGTSYSSGDSPSMPKREGD